MQRKISMTEFDPGFPDLEHVSEAVAYCNRFSDPQQAMLKMVTYNLELGEVGFASELIREWEELDGGPKGPLHVERGSERALSYTRNTAQAQNGGGIPYIAPNRTDEVDTRSPYWYVSYNNRDTGTYGSDTTALVLGQGECFLILDGDHRRALQEVIDEPLTHSGLFKLVRCLEYVRRNAHLLNHMSDLKELMRGNGPEGPE